MFHFWTTVAVSKTGGVKWFYLLVLSAAVFILLEYDGYWQGDDLLLLELLLPGLLEQLEGKQLQVGGGGLDVQQLSEEADEQ